MADYYPLIARAVSGLDKNTGEMRGALYERARSAQVNQLRGADPPLIESDIIRERLALEEAIRKVEAEAAKRSRSDAADDRPPLRDDFSAPPREELRPSLSNEGVRGFREMGAKGLGGAVPEANRSARDVYEAVPTGRPPHDELRVPDADDTVFDPSAADGLIRPVRSYGWMIKIVPLLLIVAGVGGAAYWQRNTLTSLVASFRNNSEMDMSSLAIPIFAYGIVAFIFAYAFFRQWFRIRS